MSDGVPIPQTILLPAGTRQQIKGGVLPLEAIALPCQE